MIYSSMSQLRTVNELMPGDIFQIPNSGKGYGYIEYMAPRDGNAYFNWLNFEGTATNYEPFLVSLTKKLEIRQQDMEFIAKQVVGLDYDEDIQLKDSGMPNLFHYYGRDSFNRAAWQFCHEFGMYVEEILQHGIPPTKGEVEITEQKDHTIFDFPTVRIIVNGKPEHYLQ